MSASDYAAAYAASLGTAATPAETASGAATAYQQQQPYGQHHQQHYSHYPQPQQQHQQYQQQHQHQYPPPPPPSTTQQYPGYTAQPPSSYPYQQQQQTGYNNYDAYGQYSQQPPAAAPASTAYSYSQYPQHQQTQQHSYYPPPATHAQHQQQPLSQYASHYPPPPPSSYPQPYAQQQQQQQHYPPPPPPPSSSSVQASLPPPLAASFVAAAAGNTEFVATPSAAVGRGAVHENSAGSQSSASVAATPHPVAGGIQFSIGGAGTKKSRWSNKDASTSSLFKQDRTEAKSVSEIAVAVPNGMHATSTAGGAVQSQSYYPYGTYGYQQQQQQPQQSTYLPPPPPPPPAAAASQSGVGDSSATFTATPAMLAYVERSLASCPDSARSQVEDFLTSKLQSAARAGGNAIDWSNEPLAWLQMQQMPGTHANQQQPSPRYGQQTQQYHHPQQHHSHNNHHASNDPNQTPLGERKAYPASRESKEYDDPDFIPFSNPNSANSTPRNAGFKKTQAELKYEKALAAKKRGRHDGTEDSDLDTPAPQAGNKKKKQKQNETASSIGSNPHDLAKVADRASRFAEYNASVAESIDSFKNPIQRHLFMPTNERRYGGSGGFNQHNQFDTDDLQLDWSSLHIVGTCEKLEKKFLRLTQAPDPSVVRPESVLKRALELILHKWNSVPTPQTTEKDHIHDYKYTCEQLKSIRQDLTVQHLIKSPLTLEVYEQHARIALEVKDFSEYNQCQTQLKNLYLDNPNISKNEIEFTMYRILYHLIMANQKALNEMLREIQNERKEVLMLKTRDNVAVDTASSSVTSSSSSPSSSPLSLALRVCLASLQSDFYTFFRLSPTLPWLGADLLKPFAQNMRLQAVKQLVQSFRPGKIELAFFVRVLGMKDETETKKYLLAIGCVLVNEETAVDTKASDVHEVETEEVSESEMHGVTHALL